MYTIAGRYLLRAVATFNCNNHSTPYHIILSDVKQKVQFFNLYFWGTYNRYFRNGGHIIVWGAETEKIRSFFFKSSPIFLPSDYN